MDVSKILEIVKPEQEREVLSEFLNCLYADNPVKYELESRKPHEPDVLVKLPEKEEYYELARILDYKLIKLRLKALEVAPKQVRVNASKFGLPERDIVKSKLKKSYITNSKDLHLLLYYDKGILNGGYPSVKLSQLYIYNDKISPLLEDGSIFKNIYIFDRRSQKILWSSSGNNMISN